MGVATERRFGEVGVWRWNNASIGESGIVACKCTGCQVSVGSGNYGSADVEGVEEDREAGGHLYYVSLLEAVG